MHLFSRRTLQHGLHRARKCAQSDILLKVSLQSRLQRKTFAASISKLMYLISVSLYMGGSLYVGELSLCGRALFMWGSSLYVGELSLCGGALFVWGSSMCTPPPHTQPFIRLFCLILEMPSTKNTQPQTLSWTKGMARCAVVLEQDTAPAQVAQMQSSVVMLLCFRVSCNALNSAPVGAPKSPRVPSGGLQV